MATHSQATKQYGRRFFIARQNGQSDKDGKPFFFEWIKELPDEREKRLFETRTGEKPKNYELFEKLDGFIVGLAMETQDFGGGKIEEHLVATMIDGSEEYFVNLGPLIGRYAPDFLKRILNQHFDPKQRLSLSPYAILDKEKERWTIGVSTFSGGNKLTASGQDAHMQGIVQPTKFFNPKLKRDEYDFSPQVEWLWKECVTWVLPKIQNSDPISAPARSFTQSHTAPPANGFESLVEPMGAITDFGVGEGEPDSLPF